MSKDNKHNNNHKKFKVIDNQRSRVDYPRQDYHEEYAAEVVPPARAEKGSRRHEDQKQSNSQDYSMSQIAGYIGIGLGIASLFMWSIILGPAAALIGYYAYNQGSKTLGVWSIGLGILAAISYLVLLPFAR